MKGKNNYCQILNKNPLFQLQSGKCSSELENKVSELKMFVTIRL